MSDAELDRLKDRLAANLPPDLFEATLAALRQQRERAEAVNVEWSLDSARRKKVIADLERQVADERERNQFKANLTAEIVELQKQLAEAKAEVSQRVILAIKDYENLSDETKQLIGATRQAELSEVIMRTAVELAEAKARYTFKANLTQEIFALNAKVAELGRERDDLAYLCDDHKAYDLPKMCRGCRQASIEWWAKEHDYQKNRRIETEERVRTLEAALAKVPHLRKRADGVVQQTATTFAVHTAEQCARLGGQCAITEAFAATGGTKDKS